MSKKEPKVFVISKSIDDCITHAEESFFVIGKLLCSVADEKLYLDADLPSMEAYLREFKFSRAFAFNAMRIHREFGAFDLTDISHDRLIKLLPLHLKENEKLDFIVMAREYYADEFNEAVKQAKGERHE